MALGNIKEDFSEEVVSWALTGRQGLGRGRRDGLRGKRHARWKEQHQKRQPVVRGCRR